MTLRLVFGCLLCFLARSPVLWGQVDSSDYRQLQFGLLGGQYYHEIDVTPDRTEIVTLPGQRFGVALRYFDRQLIGFQAEISYEQAGWQETLQGLTERYSRRTDYLDVQILTQLSIGRGVVQPLLQAGPFVAFPVSEEEMVPSGYDPELEAANAYYDRPLDFRVNYGLRGGFGLNFELGRVSLQIEGRYLQGFSDLIKPGQSQVSTSRRQAYGAQAALFFAIE